MCSNPVSDTWDRIICKLKTRKLGILHLDVDRRKEGEGERDYSWGIHWVQTFD